MVAATFRPNVLQRLHLAERDGYYQNPNPGPSNAAVPSVPSVTLNIEGNLSAQPALPAGQYCRALPSMAVTVGIRAESVAECRNDAHTLLIYRRVAVESAPQSD